ncbi:formate/nitrite transporter family protein [Nocardioides sp. CER19]|uniref:formate/nitrite transporter family protein n=1 Tax=Nocardioides sp. CER19 TaxID=3038538 RepID=UPI00244CE4BA|nr:formate/nitrite transporter family protein [Nocardioides sp. CER19]MDH2414189.1 formate/nitrite transporter family protein [Nocardioides sp. CER19]
MSFNAPLDITRLAISAGEAKAAARPGKALVAGFLAGAYIAFGALIATVTSAGLDPKQWGGITTLITGVTFSLGLILVIIAGADLLTGNMMLVPLAVLAKRVTAGGMLMNWFWVTIGNLVGSLFVAWVLGDLTGIFASGTISHDRLEAIATGKGIDETHSQQFFRAIGCNWLVCLAVWIALAATSVGGKILAIVPPIAAFVALGFDHVVANMFFLPAAMMVGAGDLTLSETVLNLVFAFLGNAIGAAVFVAGAYFYLYGDAARETAATPPPAGERIRD